MGEVGSPHNNIEMAFRRVASIALAVAMAAMFACTAPRQVVSTPQLPTLPNDSLRALFFYTEGLKASLVLSDTASARAMLRQALSIDPDHAPSLYEMAQSYINEPAIALPYIKRAVEQDSTNNDYLSLLGRTLVLSNNFKEATPIYKKLTHSQPRNPLNYRMLAALYDQEGLQFSAIAVLDTAETKLGRIEELSNYKRELLMRVNLLDKAIEETQTLIAEYPHDYVNYLILAEFYATQDKNDSLTLATYNQALAADSMAIGTLRSLAGWYRREGNEKDYLTTVRRLIDHPEVDVELKKDLFEDITASIDFYRRNFVRINTIASALLLQYPDNYSVMELYTTHLLRMGEMEQALQMFKNHIGNHPKHLEAYYNIIDMENYLERPDSVIKYSAKALNHFPKDIDLHLRLAYQYTNMGNLDKAIDTYKEAYHIAPTDSLRSMVMANIANTYHDQNNTKKAYSFYRKALRIFPDNEMALNNYAYYLSEENRDLQKALEMSTRACELAPSTPTYLDTKAWILHQLGRDEEAKPIMLQAVSLDNTDSTVLMLHYGDILYSLGEEFMAGIYWRRALNNGHNPQEVAERLKMIQ